MENPVFNASLVREGGPWKSGKTTSVISTESGKVIAVYPSRTECARALGIKQTDVTLLVFGQTKLRLQDVHYGSLKLVDGDENERRRMVPPEHQFCSAPAGLRCTGANNASYDKGRDRCTAPKGLRCSAAFTRESALDTALRTAQTS